MSPKVGSYIAEKMEEDMTEVKPTTARTAAEHIFQRWIYNIGYDRKQTMKDGSQKTIGEQNIEMIEAIILKHCPQDKAGKLVEIAKQLISHKSEVAGRGTWPHGGLRQWGWVMKLIRIAEAALPDYEGKQSE